MRRISNIIVAFSKLEDAKNIKNILVRSGFSVTAVCTSGAQAIASLEELSGGIVVSGFRFADMMYRELCDCMPEGFDMLLLASPLRLGGEEPEGIVSLPLPLKVHALVDALSAMENAQERKRKLRRQTPVRRSAGQNELIVKAKMLLMEHRDMTEQEAYRYIQKYSMDTSSSMTSTAQMVVNLLEMQDSQV